MANLTRLTLALASIGMIGGCAVGPDYQRPEAALPQQFASDSNGAGQQQLQPEWWKQFNDPLLNRLVASALEKNTDVQRALARVEETDALLREATATLWPEIYLQASGSRSRVSTTGANPVTAPTRNNFRGVFSTSYELDFWGKARRAEQVARAQSQSSRYAREALNLTLAGSVVQTYVTLRSQDALLQTLRDSLASRQQALDLTSRRARGGVAGDLDVQQATLSLANLQRQLLGMQQQRALTDQQLGLLSGNLGQSVAAADLRTLPLPATPPAGLPSQLLEARPDVRQAEAELIAANARIGVAKAALFPSISLTGNLGGESKELGDLLQAGSRVWSAGLGLNLPIFDFGRLSARTDQARAQQKQLLAGYQRALQNAFVDVNNALIKLRTAADSQAAAQQAAAAADKSLKLSELRYKSGYSAFLEVLVAQGNANDAALNLIQEKRDRLLATGELYKALGGGWNG